MCAELKCPLKVTSWGGNLFLKATACVFIFRIRATTNNTNCLNASDALPYEEVLSTGWSLLPGSCCYHSPMIFFSLFERSCINWKEEQSLLIQRVNSSWRVLLDIDEMPVTKSIFYQWFTFGSTQEWKWSLRKFGIMLWVDIQTQLVQ